MLFNTILDRNSICIAFDEKSKIWKSVRADEKIGKSISLCITFRKVKPRKRFSRIFFCHCVLVYRMVRFVFYFLFVVGWGWLRAFFLCSFCSVPFWSRDTQLKIGLTFIFMLNYTDSCHHSSDNFHLAKWQNTIQESNYRHIALSTLLSFVDMKEDIQIQIQAHIRWIHNNRDYSQ